MSQPPNIAPLAVMITALMLAIACLSVGIAAYHSRTQQLFPHHAADQR